MSSRSRPAQDLDARTGLRAVLADVVGIAGSQYALRFATMIRSFVVARVLGPAGNGLWQHYSLIFEYGQTAQFGVMEGYNKRIGHLLGQRDDTHLERARTSGLAGVLMAGVLLWVVLIVLVASRWDRMHPTDRWALPVLGVLVILEQLTNVYKALLRAYGRIPLITAVQLRFALSNLVLSLALLPGLEMTGLLGAWLVTRAGTTFWLVRRSDEPMRFAIQWAELRTLLVTGFPIWGYNLTKLALRNVDRVLVDSVLAKDDLGIYGLAVTLASLVRYSADSVGFVIYPIFLRLYGETRDPARLREHLEKPSAFLSLLVSIVLGFSFLVLHLPVLWFLPDFVASIEIFRLLTVSTVFSCLSILPGFYLMAIDRQNWLVPLGLGAAAFNYFVGLAAIRAGWGLPGVAMATATGLFLHCTVVLTLCGRYARGSVAAGLRWAAGIYLPVLWVAGVVAAIRLSAPHLPMAAWGETSRASVEGAVFVLVSVPLLVHFERRTGAIRKLRQRRAGPAPPPRED